MQKMLIILLGGVILLTGCHHSSNEPEDLNLASLEQSFHELIEDHRFNGSVVVYASNKPYFRIDTGFARLEPKNQIQPNTKFDIASVNKSFIAALTLIAIEDGKFGLNSKLTDLLKRYTYKGHFGDSISIHQMLSHTSGLPDYDAVLSVSKELVEDRYKQFKRTHFTNTEYVDFISRLPPHSNPGTQFYYSNFAYHLLCIVLEDAYGMHFSELLETKLAKPLGLSNTICAVDNNQHIDHLAQGYIWNTQIATWQPNDYIDLSLGRRIFSTTEDLAKWAIAIEAGTFLSDDLHLRMLSNQIAGFEKDISYGYGWVIFEEGDAYKMGNLEISAPFFIHGGNTGGYKAMLVNINHGQYVISMLTNTGQDLNEIEFIKSIAQTLIQS